MKGVLRKGRSSVHKTVDTAHPSTTLPPIAALSDRQASDHQLAATALHKGFSDDDLRLSAEAALPPPIQIEIDPRVQAASIYGRYDLIVRGKVISTSRVKSVTLLVNNAVLGRIRYGQLARDGSDGASVETSEDRASFTMTLPLSREAARGWCCFELEAQTTTEETFRETFTVSIDPSKPHGVTVISGSTDIGFDESSCAPILLYVERAAMDGGGHLVVRGWTLSVSAIRGVRVIIMGHINAASLGGWRDDVAKAFPSVPKCSRLGLFAWLGLAQRLLVRDNSPNRGDG